VCARGCGGVHTHVVPAQNDDISLVYQAREVKERARVSPSPWGGLSGGA
jgi:hypothetical protein